MRASLAALALAVALHSAWSSDRVESRPDPRGSRELVWRDGRLAEERVAAKDGGLLEESFYGPEGLAERRIYLRERGRLVRVEAMDTMGALVGALDYRYDATGRLAGLSGTGSLGESSAGMVASGGPPRGSWVSSGKTLSIQSYDGRGRPLFIETLEEGKTLRRERRSYAEGPFPSRIVLQDIPGDSVVATDFDGEGKPVQAVESRGGAERSRKEYRYGDTGLLLEETTRRAGSTLSRRLTWEADGSLTREEYRRDGVIQRVLTWEGLSRVEELYDAGALFVRSWWSGGLKTKDVFYMDGAPARTKEYR